MADPDGCVVVDIVSSGGIVSVKRKCVEVQLNISSDGEWAGFEPGFFGVLSVVVLILRELADTSPIVSDVRETGDARKVGIVLAVVES